jgi:hypothetical protein
MALSRFALLVSPTSNRVYTLAAPAMLLAELQVVAEGSFPDKLSDVRVEVLGSVSYVTFAAEALDAPLLAWLSNLSGTFALFAYADAKLTPLELTRWDAFDSDLISIQKYPGKTNESFTKLLLNVTLAASAFAAAPENRALSVLDPLCGRGTSLNQALMYGFHATGVELDKQDFEAYCLFLQRWVKDKRLKHQAVRGQVKGHAKLDLSLGRDKARYQAGETLRVNYVSADTLAVAEVFQPRSFDLIVTDAPYGVKHGSKSQAGLSRKPLELLSDAIPIWRGALRAGGALGIAWNRLVASREKLAEILARSGLSVCDSPAYRSFEHRVDRSILRDIIVARLTSP